MAFPRKSHAGKIPKYVYQNLKYTLLIMQGRVFLVFFSFLVYLYWIVELVWVSVSPALVYTPSPPPF